MLVYFFQSQEEPGMKGLGFLEQVSELNKLHLGENLLNSHRNNNKRNKVSRTQARGTVWGRNRTRESTGQRELAKGKGSDVRSWPPDCVSPKTVTEERCSQDQSVPCHLPSEVKVLCKTPSRPGPSEGPVSNYNQERWSGLWRSPGPGKAGQSGF